MAGIKNITISGEIGTGTTTLAKALSEKLNWKMISAGEYFRKWHKDNNIHVKFTDKIPEEIDREIDYSLVKKVQTEDYGIYDWRVAGILIHNNETTIKILLTCDVSVAIDRIIDRELINREEAVVETQYRSQELNKKFSRLYGADNYLDPKHFDIVVDTTDKSPQKVVEIVLKVIDLV